MNPWEYLVVSFENGPASQQPKHTGRWTYDGTHRLVEGSVEDILNALGKEAWELVGFGTGSPLPNATAVFKRPKP